MSTFTTSFVMLMCVCMWLYAFVVINATHAAGGVRRH